MAERIIGAHIEAAFRAASSNNPDVHDSWIRLSVQLGSRLPKSLLHFSIQRVGEIDLVLRKLESEMGDGELGMQFHYHVMFAEIWVGLVYEVFRTIIEHGLAPEISECADIAHHLRLIRIPLEKHQIAADKKLVSPLELMPFPAKEGDVPRFYSRDDPKRSHIMPRGMAEDGSVMWHVIDVAARATFWITRRSLSDRIVALAAK